MKQQILEVLLPFFSFLHAFHMKMVHNMLVLMFDARLKSMRLIITFLTHENVAIIVAKYDQELLLPLVIKATKLLKICNFKAMLKFFFKSHRQMQTLLRDLVSRKVLELC